MNALNAELSNPMRTDGFEFVEYAAPDPELLRRLFESMGLPAVARHRSKNVSLHRHGDINFIINAEHDSFAQKFARAHGPCACAMAFRVSDARFAYARALELGAKPGPSTAGPMELNIPCIEGIGGSLIYLVDRYGERTIYDVDFLPVSGTATSSASQDVGLTRIDHLTHNVRRGNMNTWAGFYEKLFNFREIRYFSIEGKETGLFSRALTSPCGKIRIPINESQDDKSQIEEYLNEYKGEGIQHIALGHRQHLPDRRCVARARGRVSGHAGHLLRGGRRPRHGTRRIDPGIAESQCVDRRHGEERHPAADFHQERHRADFL